MLSTKTTTDLADSEHNYAIASTKKVDALCDAAEPCSTNQATLFTDEIPQATGQNCCSLSNNKPFPGVNNTEKEYSSFDSVISADTFPDPVHSCMDLKTNNAIEGDSQNDSVINDDIFTPQSCNVSHNTDPPEFGEIHDKGKINPIKPPKQTADIQASCLDMAESLLVPELESVPAEKFCKTQNSENYDAEKFEDEIFNPFMATSSKKSGTKLPAKSAQSKFATDDPNPNRPPTSDEILFSVPHLPRFSVRQHPTGENLELSLMKREIEMRLRVNEMSWVTQRAIREESSRVKKVCKNNLELQQRLERYDEKLTSNQLILDYDKEKKTFIRVHPALVTRMKPHQKEGVKFMYDCCYANALDSKKSKGSGCILAHCMGLGKTLQVIALINTVISYSQMDTKRIIIVCPKSTVMNWNQEFRDWLADVDCNVRLLISYFPDASNIYKKLDVLKSFFDVSGKTASCLLIGYEAYRSLVFYDSKNKHGEQQSDRIRADVRRYLINPGADLIVLDEGHIIKNRKSMTNLALAEVATKRRIILTGTPIQNNLNEYFCMVSFVKPAYLGNEREFNEHYAKPIKEGQHKDSNPVEIKLMKMKSYILHKHLTEFVHRKEFSVLKEFLPKKYDFVIYVPLTPVQEDLYEDYLRRYPFKRDIGGLNLLEDYTFLRKIWTHPIVLEQAWENAMKRKYGIVDKKRTVRGFDSSSEDEDADDNCRSITNAWWKQFISADDLESIFPSNKMLLLFEILKMCQERGEKCLIFSGFVMVLNMVEYFMKKIDEQDANPKAELHGLSRFRGPWRPGMDYYRIDGGTAKSTRHEMVTKFNDLNNRITRVFLISTKAGGQGINLVGANRVVILDTSWNPAVDQQGIFRIYRLGQTKTCYIYRLLAVHTMEEKVYSRAVTKQATSHRVADKKQVDRNYNMAELEELYHFERVDMAAREDPPPAEDDLLSVLLWKYPKLIYRYHTHEMMLDNKTEKDLTELEKRLAWAEFKKKGLTTSLGEPFSQIDSQFDSDSQASFSTVENNLNQIYDPFDNYFSRITHALKQPVVDLVKSENKSSIFGDDPYEGSSIGSKSIIAEQRIKYEPKMQSQTTLSSHLNIAKDEIDLLRELEENSSRTKSASSIFGEDPYEDASTGSMSIIEEQRLKFKLKQLKTSPSSRLNIAKAEIDVLRELEEDNLRNKNDFSTTQEESRSYTEGSSQLFASELIDSHNVPYDEEEESTEESLQLPIHEDSLLDAKESQFDFDSQESGQYSTLCSLIEYDPVGDTQEFNSSIVTDTLSSNDATIVEPTYENFKANMLQDKKVVTSTANSPVVVVEVVSSSPFPSREPVMTRAMKRKIVAVELKDVGCRRSKRNRVIKKFF